MFDIVLVGSNSADRRDLFNFKDSIERGVGHSGTGVRPSRQIGMSRRVVFSYGKQDWNKNIRNKSCQEYSRNDTNFWLLKKIDIETRRNMSFHASAELEICRSLHRLGYIPDRRWPFHRWDKCVYPNRIIHCWICHRQYICYICLAINNETYVCVVRDQCNNMRE